MRIRKNAKLSSLLFSHASGAEGLQSHVCLLNQSPWDVIRFGSETNPSSNQQFEGEDSLIANGSFSDSIGAVESVASMMEFDDKAAIMKANEMFIDDNEMPKVSRVFDDNDEMKIDKEFGLLRGGKLLCCNKSDGKGWQCKNVPKDGHSLCEHHLTLLKSHNNNNNNNSTFNSQSIKKEKSAISRRGRARVAKKGSSSTSNPYEFYYYSGFGPCWGKRRGDRASEGGKSEAKDLENVTGSGDTNIASVVLNNKSSTPSSSSQIDNNEEFDYVDDDIEDDEDDENGNSSGKKRMRKPVKARSLKSLM